MILTNSIATQVHLAAMKGTNCMKNEHDDNKRQLEQSVGEWPRALLVSSQFAALLAAVLLGNAWSCGAQIFLPVGGAQGLTSSPQAVAASSDGLVVVGTFYPPGSYYY